MPHSTTLQPFVDRLCRRSVLTDHEQRELLELPIRVSQARAKEDVVRLGEVTDHACFVVDGLLGRFGQNTQGERQITALHIPGEMPDLHSVVQPKAAWSLEALTTSTVLFIPHEAIRALTRTSPGIAEAFWRDCAVDALILAQWVVNVGRRNAMSRLAHLLCEMACRYHGQPGDSLVYHLPMTQEQTADATGLTSVHVNRTLRSLAGIGTTFHHGTVRIANWDALVEIGDFDPTYLQMDQSPEERIRITQ